METGVDPLDYTDASRILDYVVGGISMIPSRAADVDGNGDITVMDAPWVLGKVHDSSVCFPVESCGRQEWFALESGGGVRRMHLESSRAGEGVELHMDVLQGVYGGYVELSLSDSTQDIGVEGIEECGYVVRSFSTGARLRMAFATWRPPERGGRVLRLVEGDLSPDGFRIRVAKLNDGRIPVRWIQIPEKFALHANYPNPFNPGTTIVYDLPREADVSLTVYTITGQRVATLASGRQLAGRYRVLWDGGGCASGIYVYRLNAGSFVDTKRMIILSRFQGTF